MAIKQRNAVKNVIGNTQLSLQADSGEAFLVKNIMIDSAANDYVILKVKNTTVGNFRVATTPGNQLPYPLQDEENHSLFGWLVENGYFDPIPVPEGEKLIIENVKQSSCVQTVVYDVVDPGDIREDMMNHPAGKNFQYVQYGEPASGAGAGDTLIDTQKSQVEFPAFPFGEDVPAGKEVAIKGILFADLAKDTSSGTNQQKTKYLKLVQDREVLFDEDRNGLLYLGGSYSGSSEVWGAGQSVGGFYSASEERLPLIFPEPLVFEEGQNLDIYVTATVDAGSANFAAADTPVGLITEVREA